MLQVCLNGVRTRDTCSDLPVTPDQLAAAAAASLAAGADDVHLHPKDSDGHDCLRPDVVAAVLNAVRAAVPARTAIGITTGAWTTPDPAERVALIRAWTVLPDHASLNWHEEHAEQLAAALLDRGVAIEAGLWSGTDGVERFQRSPVRDRVLRILAEITDRHEATAAATARSLLAELRRTLPELQSSTPVLLHGEDGGAWPVIRLAASLGLATRMGLEDTLHLPDGTPARSNAELIAAALTEGPSARRPNR